MGDEQVTQIQKQIDEEAGRYGYLEVAGDDIRALPFGWLDQRGYRMAHRAGTDTYVVYRQRTTGVESWQQYAERVHYVPTPFSRDSVASRIMNGPVEEAAGAVLTPEVLEAAQRQIAASRQLNSYDRPPLGQVYWADGETAFRFDESVPLDEVRFEFPRWGDTRPDQEILDEAASVLAQTAQELDKLLTEAPPHGLAQEANATATGALVAAREEAARRAADWYGDHYRADQDACVCGFFAIRADIMAEHLDDVLVEGSDGVPKRWRCCERCWASTLCREVVIAGRLSLSFGDSPSLLPVGPVTERVYRCDDCTRGL
jgi:hypothetical protein